MPTKMTVLVDAHRIRIEFTGDVVGIEGYLDSKNYINTSKLVNDARTRMAEYKQELKQLDDYITFERLLITELASIPATQPEVIRILAEQLYSEVKLQSNSPLPNKITGSMTPYYNFVWSHTDDGKGVNVDFVHQIRRHHTNEGMLIILSRIIGPLCLPPSDAYIAPNKDVRDLKSNLYENIFTLEGIDGSNICVSVINVLEQIAKEICGTNELSSKSNVATEEIPRDTRNPIPTFFGGSRCSSTNAAGAGAAAYPTSVSSMPVRSAPQSMSVRP